MAEHRVAALVLSGTNVFELAVACEVFGLQRPELGVDWYRFDICSPERGLVELSGGGFPMVAHGDLDDLATADTVVLPASPDTTRRVADDVIEAIVAAHDRGGRVLSFCSGAFTLGDTGLLDGRRATTHWMHAEEFRARFPAVELVPDVLYIDEGTVMTSAGTAAAIDLSLHVVRLDHGIDIANAVARRMVIPPHRHGGQAQYAEAPIPEPCDTPGFSALLDWMTEHLHEPLSVRELAARLHVSPRTFARRFREVTGSTPHAWLTSRRVDHARLLLEATDEPVERIAVLAGFGTPPNLRKQFRAAIGISPREYRRLFGVAA